MKKSLSAIIFAILLTSVFVFSSFPMLYATSSNQTTSTNTSTPSKNWNDIATENDKPVYAYNESVNTYAYHISSAPQLAYISQQVAAYRSVTIVLNNDIDLSSHYWTPIGTSENAPFNGTFDGNWHKITGLNVSNFEYAGLFGYVGAGANIKNLIVENATVTGTKYAGTIAGYSNYYYGGALFKNLIVKNPIIKSTNDTISYAGGIVGRKDGGSIINCYVQADATNNEITSNGGKAGGIVGILGKGNYYGTIKLCYNNVKIVSKTVDNFDVLNGLVGSCAGGIVGYSANGSNTIDQCYNTGKITSTSTKHNSYSGGIVGYTLGGEITNCYNEGEISSEVKGWDNYFDYDLNMYKEDWSSLSSDNPYGYEVVEAYNGLLNRKLTNPKTDSANMTSEWQSTLYKSPSNVCGYDGKGYIGNIHTSIGSYYQNYKFNAPRALSLSDYISTIDYYNDIGGGIESWTFISKDVYNPRGEKLQNKDLSNETFSDTKIDGELVKSAMENKLNSAQITTNDTGSFVGVNKYSGHTGGIAGCAQGNANIEYCYNRGTINTDGCAKTKYFNFVYQIYKATRETGIEKEGYRSSIYSCYQIYNLRGLPTCRLQLLVNFDIGYYSDNICGEQIGTPSISNCFYEKLTQIKKELRINCNQSIYIMCKTDGAVSYDVGATPNYLFGTITGYSYRGDHSDNSKTFRNMTKNKWGSSYDVDNEGNKLQVQDTYVVGEYPYPWYLNYVMFPKDNSGEWHSPFRLRLCSFFTIDTSNPYQIKFYIKQQQKSGDISNEGILYEAINTYYDKNSLENNTPYFKESETNKKSIKENINLNSGVWGKSGAINDGYPHLKGFYW